MALLFAVGGCGPDGDEGSAESDDTSQGEPVAGVVEQASADGEGTATMEDSVAADSLSASGDSLGGLVSPLASELDTLQALAQRDSAGADGADEEPAAGTAVLPAGTEFFLTSDRELSTRWHRVGDPVIATVAEDVADTEGRVLVLQGAKLLGRISLIADSPGPGEDAILDVRFETLSTDSYESAIDAVVTEAEIEIRGRRGVGDRAAPGVIPVGGFLVAELAAPLVLSILTEDPTLDSLLPDAPDGAMPDTSQDTTRLLVPMGSVFGRLRHPLGTGRPEGCLGKPFCPRGI